MVKLTFFLSGGSQEGADLVAPDVSEFGLSKCSFQQRVTLLFFFFILFDYLKNALIEHRFWLLLLKIFCSDFNKIIYYLSFFFCRFLVLKNSNDHLIYSKPCRWLHIRHSYIQRQFFLFLI